MNESLTSIIMSDLIRFIETKVSKLQTINGKVLDKPLYLTKADIGLSNVNNTSDVNKPVSTAQQTALNLKVDKSITINGLNLNQNINLTNTNIIGIENINNTSDMDKPVSTAQQTALNLKVDKTTTINGVALSSNVNLNKSDIGLDQVDNTSDVNKPISTAVQLILDNIVNSLNMSALSVENMNTSLDTYVKKTTLINNYPLSTNINLIKSDIGLDQVDNTSDINKPISTLQQASFNLKENISNKNNINGYAGLDNSNLIFKSQLPQTILMPIGSIICFSSSNIPDSYLFCDGSEVPIIEYPLLYSVIGTQYNRPGINAVLFFHLPDLRNQFIRCIDQSRTLGSLQSWSTGMPTNQFTTDTQGNHTHTTDDQGSHSHATDVQGDHTHTTDVQGNHTHNFTVNTNSNDNWGPNWALTGPYNPTSGLTRSTTAAGDHSHTTTVGGSHSHTTTTAGSHSHTTTVSGDHSHTINGGDLETRPNNIALYYIIKALI
jgi:microcystin-dependent protein